MSFMFVFSSTGTNPYLTFHCVNQGTILLDLAPEDKEYQSVEEEVTDRFRPFFFDQVLLRLFSRGRNSTYLLRGRGARYSASVSSKHLHVTTGYNNTRFTHDTSLCVE